LSFEFNRCHLPSLVAIRHISFRASVPYKPFSKLQTMRVEGLIDNLYQVSRQLFVPIIRQFILEHLAKPMAA